jgi:nucleoside-diphosphate-sugar epimerase
MAAATGRVLLTGGAGVVGQALLERLRAENVVCLVHRHSVGRDGVECVAGDATAPLLGLTEERHAALASEIDCVIHSAAITNFFTVEREAIERANVAATAGALELAARADAPLHFISTAFVGGGPDARPGEGEPRRELPGIAAAAEGYRVSKLESERLVRDSGLPCAVHRPSIMFGDSRTGAMSRFQGIHATFHAMVRGEIPALPVSPDGRLDLIPQDVVADAIVGLVEQGVHEGLFWITLGDRALPVERVAGIAVETLGAAGFEFTAPAIVDPGVIDQLMAPETMAQLPDEARENFERQLAGLIVAGPREPMPSSLDDLEARGVASLDDPASAFVNGFLYWARAKGIIAAA